MRDAQHVRAGLGNEAQLDEALRMQQGVAAGAGRARNTLRQPLGSACCRAARGKAMLQSLEAPP